MKHYEILFIIAITVAILGLFQLHTQPALASDPPEPENACELVCTGPPNCDCFNKLGGGMECELLYDHAWIPAHCCEYPPWDCMVADPCQPNK